MSDEREAVVNAAAEHRRKEEFEYWTDEEVADFSLAENAELRKELDDARNEIHCSDDVRLDQGLAIAIGDLQKARAAAEAEVVKAIEEEREACALLAENFGPSRPLSVTASHSILCRGRWEGEQAASKNIAAAIRARSAKEGL